MAAPTWDGLVKTVQTGLTTPHVINMPTGLANGDGVVVVTTMGRNRTQGLNWNTGTTGFSSVLSGTVFATNGNDMELDIGWRVMPSEGGLPSSISLTPSQTKSFAAWAGRVPAGTFDPATTPVATQTPNSSDPASLDPPWDEDTLFIAGYVAEEFTFSSFPLADDQANDETGLATGAVCSIGQTGGAARNVAAWATFEADRNGVAVIAIRGAVSGSGGTATPSAITVVSALPSATLSTAAGPAAVAVAGALPAVSPSGGVSKVAPLVGVVAATPAPALSVTAGPSVVAAVASLPAPVVDAGGGATATPAVVAAVAALPSPGLSTGAGPAAVAGAAATPAPTTGSGTSPQPVAATLAAPAPAVGAGATAPALAGVVAVPAPVPAVAAGPAGVAAVSQVPRPAAGSGASPTTAALPASLPAPTVDTSGAASVSPSTIPVIAAVLRPAVDSGAAEVAADRIVVSASRVAHR